MTLVRPGFAQRWTALGAAFLLFLGSSLAAPATYQFNWNRQSKLVTAHLEGVSLEKFLPRLARASGWQIFIEPGLDKTLSVKFTASTPGEALKLLLPDFSFALVPQGTGPSKLFIYKNSVKDATEAVVADRPANWLEKEILLTMDPDRKQDINALARELGATIAGGSDALNTYRLQFDSAEAAEAARDKLAARDDVEISDNFEYQRPEPGQLQSTGSTNPTFGLDSKPVADGTQIKVALIDTYVQPLEGKMNDFLTQQKHLAGQPTEIGTTPTHGTSMAQTLLNSMALASKDQTSVPVALSPFDVYGPNPTTTTFEVANGLYAAIQSNPHVINMSLGGTGQSPVMEALLEVAHKKNIIVFASAGNSPTADLTFPAASPNAIAVTAADWRGNIAPYANYGSFVDVKAPGTATIRYNGQTFISSGTSTATAFVAGQAAAYRAQGLTQEQTVQLIMQRFNVNTPPKK